MALCVASKMRFALHQIPQHPGRTSFDKCHIFQQKDQVSGVFCCGLGGGGTSQMPSSYVLLSSFSSCDPDRSRSDLVFLPENKFSLQCRLQTSSRRQLMLDFGQHNPDSLTEELYQYLHHNVRSSGSYSEPLQGYLRSILLPQHNLHSVPE